MKIAIDERVKYRLTGFIVLLSVAVIFVPAMIKKSTQRLGENTQVSIQLPPRPVAPRVSFVSEKTLFEAVKVAHVHPIANPAPLRSQIAELRPLLKSAHAVVTDARVAELAPHAHVVLKQPAIKPMKTAALPLKPRLITPTIMHAKPQKIKESAMYAVQLASFIDPRNANVLVKRLREHGYKASAAKVTHPQYGAMYQVVVGQLIRRDDALNLRKKLASTLQLNGFVIETAVG